jgi:hypothetical protein
MIMNTTPTGIIIIPNGENNTARTKEVTNLSIIAATLLSDVINGS